MEADGLQQRRSFEQEHDRYRHDGKISRERGKDMGKRVQCTISGILCFVVSTTRSASVGGSKTSSRLRGWPVSTLLPQAKKTQQY